MKTVLQTENLGRQFWGLSALSAVNIELIDREILGVIGPNGAGKTTLINVVCGVFLPTEGRIIFDGKDITRSPAHVRCRLGIVRTFQIASPLQDLTLLGNVMTGALFGRGYGMREGRERAKEVCEFMGLVDVGRDITKLTALETKKMEVARALATEPKILLLDELMAGLSTDEADEMIDLVRRIRDTGTSICVIEHVMRIIRELTDRVVVLDWGKKIADGPYAEVSNDTKVISAYLGEEA